MFTKNDTKTDAQKHWIKKRLIIFVAIVIVLVVALDISPVGGNIRFYTKWAECGTKPVASDTTLHINGSQPHYYKQAYALPKLRGPAKFFCTPLDAEKAGYSANKNQYEFPMIEKYNAEHPDHKIHFMSK